MTTRRNILTGGAGLAAILASGKAPAYLVKSMLASRGSFLGRGGEGGGDVGDVRAVCFTAEEPDSSVTITQVGSPGALMLEYSVDGKSWSVFTAGSTVISLMDVGDRAWIRADSSGNISTATNNANYHKVVITGKVAASGDCTALLDAKNEVTSVVISAFAYLFYGCTGLTMPPDLPSAEISTNSYSNMFNGCTSLKEAPVLPATTLKSGCYNRMFNGCISLVKVPELPASTLVSGCYVNLFYGCSSLKEITTRQTSFTGCNQWLSGVSGSGTFRCLSALGTDATITRGVGACPQGWTVINTD